MTKVIRQPFRSNGRFVARRVFCFDGKNYTAGDPFPWQEVGCTERRLRQLYDHRTIELEPEDKVDSKDKSNMANTKSGDAASGKNKSAKNDQ